MVSILAPEHPRTTPPLYQYRWAIDAVKQIPGYMLAHNKFAEPAFVITVDGVNIGPGMLEQGAIESAYQVVKGKGSTVNVSSL